MSEKSFFKKVVSYLAELNKGEQYRLTEDGWLNEEEVYRINIILSRLGFVEKNEEEYHITGKGLNVLLYYKMGKMDHEDEDLILELLLSAHR